MLCRKCRRTRTNTKTKLVVYDTSRKTPQYHVIIIRRKSVLLPYCWYIDRCCNFTCYMAQKYYAWMHFQNNDRLAAQCHGLCCRNTRDHCNLNALWNKAAYYCNHEIIDTRLADHYADRMQMYEVLLVRWSPANELRWNRNAWRFSCSTLRLVHKKSCLLDQFEDHFNICKLWGSTNGEVTSDHKAGNNKNIENQALGKERRRRTIEPWLHLKKWQPKK